MADGNNSGRSMDDALSILRNLLSSPELTSCVANAIDTPSPVNNANVDAEVRGLFRPQNSTFGRIGARHLPSATTEENPQFRARRFSSWTSKGKKRARPSPFHRTFNKDIILLPSPRANCVVRQDAKRKLHERGYVLNAFEFHKTWDHCTVLHKIRDAFKSREILPDNVSLEVLMPCGSKLVAPALCKDQQLDAGLIQKIFKRASLYIRPSELLESMSNESSDTEDSVIEEEMVTGVTGTSPHHQFHTQEHSPNSQRESAQPSTSGQARIHQQNNYGAYISLIANDSDEESDALYSAITASIEDLTRPKEEIPIGNILKELGEKINSKNICKFNINRSNVLDGAVRGFRRLTYNPNNTMSIKFSDDKGMNEEAIDLGGPRREFLRLLMEALSQSDMFEGQEGHLNLALDSKAVREDRYFIAGAAIAVSLVHGGPAPCFLSKTLFTCISEGPEMSKPVLDDITDADLLQKLHQISDARSLEDLKLSIESLTDYLANAGCLRNVTTLTDKYQLLEDILMFQVVHRVRGPLERFMDGLKTLGVLQKIRLHPEAFHSVLCYSPTNLTADTLDELFQIRWSETGSNKRAYEDQIVAFWRDFLQDVEEEAGTTTLQDVLAFATGSNAVPPIGFSPQPSVEFLHGGGKYPLANTCVNCLRLPIYSCYDAFKDAMDFAIRNTQGFGMV